MCACVCRLFPPVTDHPPALVLPIHVSVASVGGQLIGFHYQCLSTASTSALPPPQRRAQSAEVKAFGSDSWRPAVKGADAELNVMKLSKTGAAEQVTSRNSWSVDVNRLIIEPYD